MTYVAWDQDAWMFTHDWLLTATASCTSAKSLAAFLNPLHLLDCVPLWQILTTIALLLGLLLTTEPSLCRITTTSHQHSNLPSCRSRLILKSWASIVGDPPVSADRQEEDWLRTGPFTNEVSQILKIRNPNQTPIAFKVCACLFYWATVQKNYWLKFSI